jgi:hypothetical protein
MIPRPACPADRRGENSDDQKLWRFSRLAEGEPRQGVG